MDASQNKTNLSISNKPDCIYVGIYHSIEMVSSILIPFIVMTTFSTFLIGMVIELRIRIQPSNSIKDEKRLRKEIQFTVTTVLISLSYVSLDLPFFIIQILILDNNLSLNFHIFSFGFTFYVLLLSN